MVVGAQTERGRGSLGMRRKKGKGSKGRVDEGECGRRCRHGVVSIERRMDGGRGPQFQSALNNMPAAWSPCGMHALAHVWMSGHV